MRTCSLALTITISSAGCLTQSFAPPHRAFVTDDAFAPDFGGLAGADAICQREADAARLGGGSTWLAWLADDTGDPTTRFTTDGAYARVDGVIIAGDFDELVSGTIRVTPTGGDPLQGCWTNVGIGGHAPTPGFGSCGNWTSRDSSLQGVTGQTNLAYDAWTDIGSQTCDPSSVAAQHLYCFEQ